jgi:hypothetical protein
MFILPDAGVPRGIPASPVSSRRLKASTFRASFGVSLAGPAISDKESGSVEAADCGIEGLWEFPRAAVSRSSSKRDPDLDNPH